MSEAPKKSLLGVSQTGGSMSSQATGSIHSYEVCTGGLHLSVDMCLLGDEGGMLPAVCSDSLLPVGCWYVGM